MVTISVLSESEKYEDKIALSFLQGGKQYGMQWIFNILMITEL